MSDKTIAADLRGRYDGLSTTYGFPPKQELMALIERTSEAEAARDALSAQLQRQTDAEVVLRGDYERMRKALVALLTKLRAILPAIDGAFVFQYIHGGRYTGPTIVAEMEQADAALKEEPCVMKRW